jgi:hypothetical protein
MKYGELGEQARDRKEKADKYSIPLERFFESLRRSVGIGESVKDGYSWSWQYVHYPSAPGA